MHCTFCIVPADARRRTQPARSRRSCGEVRELVARGVKEVTLLGQIVNLYGRHEFPEGATARVPFVQLLEAVHAVDGLERLRFTSPHPIGFRDDLVGAFARSAETVPTCASAAAIRLGPDSQGDASRLHGGEISRPGRPNSRAARPDIAITTDMIVGFPARPTRTTKQTRDLVERIQFDNAFVFRYSPAARHAGGGNGGANRRAGERSSAIRICSRWWMRRRRRRAQRLVGREWRSFAKARAKRTPSA